MDFSLLIQFPSEDKNNFNDLRNYLVNKTDWEVKVIPWEKGRSSHWYMLFLTKKDIKKPEIKLAIISLAIALIQLGVECIDINTKPQQNVIKITNTTQIEIKIDNNIIIKDDSITIEKLEKLKNQ